MALGECDELIGLGDVHCDDQPEIIEGCRQRGAIPDRCEFGGEFLNNRSTSPFCNKRAFDEGALRKSKRVYSPLRGVVDLGLGEFPRDNLRPPPNFRGDVTIGNGRGLAFAGSAFMASPAN
jgi:hypothetical protein